MIPFVAEGVNTASCRISRLQGLLTVLWENLASIRLFFWAASLLALAAVVGTFIPQGQSAELLAQNYGPLQASILSKSGLSDLYRSWWFVALLSLLGLNVFACSLRRIQAVKARPGVFLAHLAILLILAGTCARALLGKRGVMEIRQGETSAHFFASDGQRRSVPFDVRLRRFWLEYWDEPEHVVHVSNPHRGFHETRKVKLGEKVRFGELGFNLEAKAFYPDFVLNGDQAGTRSLNARNPALELLYARGGSQPKRFVAFARFPEAHGAQLDGVQVTYEFHPGRIRQFKSELEIWDGGEPAVRKTVEVNSPVTYKGYKLYQYSYDPETLESSSFLVAKDPSVPWVYLGFLFLSAGLVWNVRWRAP